MATLISCATGNWTDSTTWGLCDSTASYDTEGGGSTPQTSYNYSATFTPGAITVDGVAVRLYSRTASSGTVTVCIGQGGNPVTGTEVTIDMVDLNDIGTSPTTVCNQSGGWYFFKFSSPVTLSAATAYTVGIKTSSGTGIYFYKNPVVAWDWARQLRTTTNQAPAAGDKLYVIGEHTGQGTGNSLTVTMNNNTTTDYGSASTTLVSLGVGKRGTLTWSYDDK